MNEELKKWAKAGDKKKFEIAYNAANKSANSDDWTIAYNSCVAELKNSRNSSSSSGSSSSSSDSGSSQNTGGSSDLFAGLAGGAVTGLGKVLGIGNDVIKGIANLSSDVFDSQMGKYGGGDKNYIDKILGIVAKAGLNPIDIAKQSADLLKDEVIEQLKEESKLLSEINTKTGISGDLSKGLREDMVLAQVEASRYGITLADIGDFYTTLSDQSGKFALINRTTIQEAAKVAGALDMSMANLASTIGEFENVGISAQDAIKTVGDVAIKSVSLGLNATKVATEMKSSIKDLNSYGFQNGVKGLERMVQKSIEFKLSMSSVLKIAEEVMDADKAINLAANLQVLGGAIGSFGDPLKMMYEATNNVEGLQDSLIGAASTLATYNQEQGRFEITGVNLRRAREMSKALGVDLGELTKSAIASQERLQASTALMSTGLQMRDDDKEFLTNLGRMQGGEMKILVPESLQDKLGKQSEITLSKLTEDQKKVLLANKDAFEKMNPEKMAMAQLTETQQMSRGIDVVASYYRILGAQQLRGATQGALSPEFKSLKDSIDTYSKSLKIEPNQTEKTKEKVESIRGMSIDAETLKSEVEKLKNLIDFNNIGKNIMQTIDKNINLTINSNNQGDALRRDMERNSSVVAEIKNLTITDDRKYA
jgi:hypothetical protein